MSVWNPQISHTMKKTFKPGDKVFARIRGYPPWPAVVQTTPDENDGRKYGVLFYGTCQIGFCKGEEMVLYKENRNLFIRQLKTKRQSYREALLQIEGLSPAPPLLSPYQDVPSGTKDTSSDTVVPKELRVIVECLEDKLHILSPSEESLRLHSHHQCPNAPMLQSVSCPLCQLSLSSEKVLQKHLKLGLHRSKPTSYWNLPCNTSLDEHLSETSPKATSKQFMKFNITIY